jgi:hypothetical protein
MDCGAVVYNADDGCWVSQSYADANLYYWDADEAWHNSCEDADLDDSDGGDDDADPAGVFSYGTNVLSIHGWPVTTPRDSLAMGVELEMEAKQRQNTHRMRHEILGARRGNGRYILKVDGSLDDYSGTELVTLPYTLADHRDVFRWGEVLTDSLRQVAKSGSGTTACGIHIHVNRAALTPLTIGKLLVFLNSPANDRFVTTVAQRGSGNACNRDGEKKITAERSGQYQRYDILNVSGGDTIEFRMFRGNLRPERVLKNLEFVDALCRYVAGTGIAESGTKAGFLKFLKERCKDYPHLVSFLVYKDVMPEPSVRSTAPYAVMARTQRAEA